MNFQIAVDGPSATGKSTLAKMLAEHFDLLYIDTGAMYRSLAYLAIKNKMSENDEESILSLFNNFNIDLNGSKVVCNGIDITHEIRQESVGIYTSMIAKYKRVREALVEYQRRIASQRDCIMDGRDIGSVVLPNAQLKIYLDASVDSRAKRRYNELLKKKIEANYDEIYEGIKMRDYEDMNRVNSPLVRSSDAVYIDSSLMSIEEEFEILCKLVVQRRKEVCT